MKIEGLPLDAQAARELAQKDPWEFEKWVCGHIGATGLYKNPGQKGADGGIDGILEFHTLTDEKNHTKAYAIVQVKSGKISVNDVKALYTDVKSEPVAKAGIFVCFEEYRRTFENHQNLEKFTEKFTNKEWPLIQLLTIEEMLAGKEPLLPNIVSRTEYKLKQPKTMEMPY